MRQKSPAYIYLILTFMSMVFLLGSCSTTKVLTEDQTRLKSNVITVVNKKEHPEYQDSQLDNYIRQQANTYIIKTKRGGWNPFIYVYNWTNGKGKGWDRFVTRLGQAPVVFDPALMEDSRPGEHHHAPEEYRLLQLYGGGQGGDQGQADRRGLYGHSRQTVPDKGHPVSG